MSENKEKGKEQYKSIIILKTQYNFQMKRYYLIAAPTFTIRSKRRRKRNKITLLYTKKLLDVQQTFSSVGWFVYRSICLFDKL